MAETIIIIEENQEDPVQTAWLPPCNGRMYNIRLIGILATPPATPDAYALFGPDVSTLDDPLDTPDEAVVEQGGNMVTLNFISEEQIVTNFRRGPWFVKRNQPIPFIAENESEYIGYVIHFDFVADHGADGRTLYEIPAASLSGTDPEDMAYFVIPFDVYVKSIETEYNISSSALERGQLRVRVVKDTPQLESLDNNASLPQGGTMIGHTGAFTGGQRVVAGNVLQDLHIQTLDKPDGSTYIGHGREKVNVGDYFPAGTILYVEYYNITGNDEPDVTLMLDWEARGRRSAKGLAHYYTGDNVYNMEDEV